MRRLTRALCLPAIAGLVFVGGGDALRAAQTPATGRPTIAGMWKLNKELSTTQGQSGSGSGSGDTSGSSGGGRGGGWGRGGGGMGGGMGRGGGGGMGRGGMGGGMGRGGAMSDEDKEKMAARRALMQEVLEVAPAVTITEGDGTVGFTFTDGRVVSYKTDGKKEKHQLTNGTIETKTKWDKDTEGLVIEMDLGDGMKVTRTYTVSGTPRQLAESIKIEGGRSPRSGGQGPPPRHHIYDDVTSTSSSQ